MTPETRERFRSAIRAGQSQGEILADMKRTGLTIMDAIKATRELFSVSLGDAKQLVSQHPDWLTVAAASAPLHESLIQSFDDATNDRINGR